jgi:hypothetical protein
MSELDLRQRLDDPSLVCTIDAWNRTPPEWQVFIKSVAVDFTHDDGSVSKDQKTGLWVGTGQPSIRLRSAGKCVKSYHIAFLARSTLQTHDQVIESTFPADPGKCIIHEDSSLGKKASITEAEFSKIKPGELLIGVVRPLPIPA